MRRMSFLTSKNLDMTEGGIYKKLWLFTIPLIFAGLLQLLYNACDLVVCGRFGSEHSVGAIGATSSIINLILNFFIGLSIGTNVLMSRAYGSKDIEKGKKIAYTSMILSIVLGIIVTIIGVIISPYFLKWMGTPDEQIDLSTDYLQIYFIGSIFTLVYNFGSSILRATGDSRKPFIFLASAGIINVILNLILVIGFKLDVKGVAIATVVSQAFSAIMILIALLKSNGFLTFKFKELKFYSKEAKEMALNNLKVLHIENLKNKSFADLSGGQRQKVLLARSLCATSKLLVLDEPSNNLDSKSKEALYATLKDLNEKGITIIMITHDLDHHNLIGNKILSLREDDIYFGSTEAFVRRIHHE